MDTGSTRKAFGSEELIQSHIVLRFMDYIKTGLTSRELGCVWLLLLPISFCLGFAIWNSLANILCKSRVQGAVDSIVRRNAAMNNRSREGTWIDDRDLDGVDLFLYHEMLTHSLGLLKVVSTWFLLLVFFYGPVILLVLCVTSVYFSFLTGFGDVRFMAVLGALSLLWLLCFLPILCKSGIVGMYRALAEMCLSRPRCTVARAFLLSCGIVYALLLSFSPVASAWRWSLVATHSTRVLSVLASLRCEVEMESEIELGGEAEEGMI